MMNFNEYGHLYPPQMIELTWPEFESFFVENLNDSTYRKDLFGQYLRFVDEFKTSFPISFNG